MTVRSLLTIKPRQGQYIVDWSTCIVSAQPMHNNSVLWRLEVSPLHQFISTNVPTDT